MQVGRYRPTCINGAGASRRHRIVPWCAACLHAAAKGHCILLGCGLQWLASFPIKHWLLAKNAPLFPSRYSAVTEEYCDVVHAA